jgi:hypothetical protein
MEFHSIPEQTVEVFFTHRRLYKSTLMGKNIIPPILGVNFLKKIHLFGKP